ncbi:MAG TPA: hypothetical protein VF070_14620 [Streptosporangiaceae bacterium]
MSVLRKSMVTALVAGALLAAPSAAFASTARHAANSTATSAVTTVHRAPCTGLTFDVYHANLPVPICYAGTGSISPRIQDVNRTTTGEYWGCLALRVGAAFEVREFVPRESINFAQPGELVHFELGRHPVTCAL